MDDFLKTLIQKEKELRLELEQTPLFKQWEGIKTTIALFQNGHEQAATNEESKPKIPKTYNDSELTWKEKVLFALSKIGEGSVADMVVELKKLGAKEKDDFLTKRVGITVSNLKVKDGVVDAKMDGKKGVYFIK